MAYKVILFTDKSRIRQWIKERDFKEFDFFLTDNIRAFISLKEEVKPHLFILDFTSNLFEPQSLSEKIIGEKIGDLWMTVLIVRDIKELTDYPFSNYVDDIMYFNEIFSPFFEKKLKLYVEYVELKRKVAKLERDLSELKEKVAEQKEDYEELILSILDLRVPGIRERAFLARDIAEYLATSIGLEGEQKERVLEAALLHEIGKIGLREDAIHPDKEKFISEKMKTYRSHALLGEKILSRLKKWQNVAPFLREQYERFDGQGFPDGLRGNQLPTEALILQAITFYEDQALRGLSKEEVLDSVRRESGKILDPYIAGYLAQYILDKGRKGNDKTIRIPICDLKPGMVLAEDLYSASGTKIISKGSKIDERTLRIIEERRNVDPVIGCAYVYR